MDQQKGKASQPKRGVQVIDPLLDRLKPVSRPQPRPQKPPRPPASLVQWPPPDAASNSMLPAAKRPRIGDMPPLPGHAPSQSAPAAAAAELVRVSLLREPACMCTNRTSITDTCRPSVMYRSR